MSYNNIPCVKQIDETSCASANYTMVAKALGLDYSLGDVLKITKSEIGFAPFWKYLVEKNNLEIVDFSQNNLPLWSEKGFADFAQATDQQVVGFFKDRIADTKKYQDDLSFLLAHKNFQFFLSKPNVNILKEYFCKGYVCDAMLDPWLIYGEKPEWYSLHRVFIIDINEEEIIFHDPSTDGGEFYKSNAANFEKAFQIDGAELTCYKKI